MSHDPHNNTYNYKYTYSIEIPPICKDDVVVLPPEISRQYGHISSVLLCYKVSNLLHFIDPNTLQGALLFSLLNTNSHALTMN